VNSRSRRRDIAATRRKSSLRHSLPRLSDMRLLALLALLAACSDDNGSTPADSSVSIDSAIDSPRADARPLTDAPPMEVCSSGGWCQVADSPSYTWAMSVAPNGQPWTVAYGVRTKTPTGWLFHDLSWPDLVNTFVVHSELYSVFALSSTDVWVGGRQGYVGHYDGFQWQQFRPAAPEAEAIWGAASNDVWLLYDSGLRYHWNGTALTSMPTSNVRFYGAWGTAANDVWGFGETVIDSKYYPAVDHYDGTAWQRIVLPGYGTVIAFWSSGPTDLYAVISLNGTTRLLHGDGTTWSAPIGPTGMQVLNVWGRAANDVWLVGRQGAIAHGSGTSWTMSASGTTKTLGEIGGTATMMWAAGDGIVLRRP
jgi:hypothetical protein